MQRWAARRQAELCHEKRLKAVGHLARKGETARGHRDSCEEEGRRGNGFSARARTEPGLMGGGCCQKEPPHRAVTQGRGCLLRLEDRSKPARGFVTSQHEDCFSVITSLRLSLVGSNQFLLYPQWLCRLLNGCTLPPSLLSLVDLISIHRHGHGPGLTNITFIRRLLH